MEENFFSVLFYSFYIFEGNYIEFKRTIESYIETANSEDFLDDNKKIVNLHINGGREIARRIHNYAAAWLSLVDHTRRVKEKLEKHRSVNYRDFANEYEARLNEYLKNTDENVFMKDLRKYVQHKKVPVPSLRFNIKRIENLSESENFLVESSYSFEFNSKDIANFKWTGQSKQYLKNNTVDIVKIIEKHFSIMKDFYLWIQFREHQLNSDVTTVKEMTFEEWKQKIWESRYNNSDSAD
jgi:hypothetical protein